MRRRLFIIISLVLVVAIRMTVLPITAVANIYTDAVQSYPNSLTNDMNAPRHNNLSNISAQRHIDYSETIRPLTQSHTENFSRDYSLTGNGATDIIAVAFAQLGKTGSQLGYTEQWCADFIGDCAILAGQSAAVPLDGYVPTFRAKLIEAGGFYSTSNPQPGDICIIDWDGTQGNDHVEIVYAVSGTTVSTIGGNTGGGSSLYTRRVATHAPLGSNYVTCIIRPNYSTSTTNPPEAPQNVRTDKSLYSCNEYITFYWDASVGATNYHIYMWKDGVELYLQDVGTDLTFTSPPTSAGNYRFIVRAGNNFGYSDGPAYVDFTVYDSSPETPIVTTDKQQYHYGEPIAVSWNEIANTEFYWFEIYDENGHHLVLDEGFDNTTTSYVVNNLPAGSYVVYVFPNNAFGYSIGECRFTVYDSIPEAPIVTTDKQQYRYGEPIVVSWNEVANTEFYWFEIYDENGHHLVLDERFDNTTTSYVVNNLPAGSYVVYVFPNNAFGYSIGECRFSVSNQLLGDANNDGELSAIDAIMLLRHSLGIITLENTEFLDVNSNGRIDSLDALLVLRVALETTSSNIPQCIV